MKRLPVHKAGGEWDGYTLQELMYHRAVTLAHIEIEKERIVTDMGRARHGNLTLTRTMFTRLLTAIGYTDYVVLAVNLWRRISPLFHKKK